MLSAGDIWRRYYAIGTYEHFLLVSRDDENSLTYEDEAWDAMCLEDGRIQRIYIESDTICWMQVG